LPGPAQRPAHPVAVGRGERNVEFLQQGPRTRVRPVPEGGDPQSGERAGPSGMVPVRREERQRLLEQTARAGMLAVLEGQGAQAPAAPAAGGRPRPPAPACHPPGAGPRPPAPATPRRGTTPPPGAAPVQPARNGRGRPTFYAKTTSAPRGHHVHTTLRPLDWS